MKRYYENRCPNSFKTKILILCFLFFPLVSFSQEILQGKIVDEDGNPISFCNVVEAGTTNGVISGKDGKFSINVSSSDATLKISRLGYLSREVKAEGRSTINIKLKKGSQSLNELVVIGYETIKKKDLTGAVSIVDGDELKNRSSENALTSLQGLMPGVKVTSSGLPGQQGHIEIRGIGSLTSNSPLIIVDGIIGGVAHLSPSDIESVQVLKDAASAAIYGSRAANGVIIITTKHGQKGPLKVNFNANLTSYRLPRYDLMDAKTWKKFDDLAYKNAIEQGVGTVTKLPEHFDASTDWQGRMLRPGLKQEYDVSLSGGGDFGKFYFSMNRLKNKGALYGSGYNRYGFRLNTSGKKGVFSFGENLSFTKTKRLDLHGNPWSDFIGISPTIPVKDPSHPGGFGYGDQNRDYNYGLNPIAMQDLFEQDNPETNFKGNVFGKIDLFSMISGKLRVSYNHYNGITNTLRKKGNWTMGQGAGEPYITFDNYRSDEITIDQIYKFQKKFGNHDIKLLIGMSYDTFLGESNYITKLDPLTNGNAYINSLDAATGTTTAGGHTDKANLISYYGRINYDYKDRYLFQANIRRDGTSRLPKKTRWGYFPSFSAGWRISNEDFFKIPFINTLKIRGSYGALGNSSIGYYDYQAVINTAPRAMLGGKELIGMIQSKLTNTDLIWERDIKTNIGLDATILDGRFSLTAEYFKDKSKDLLVYLPILMSTGNEGGNPPVNAGSLLNTGVEIDLGWKDLINKDFSYSVSVNLSTVHNKILDLGYGRTVYYESLSRAKIGKPLGMFYLYKMLGIFQNKKEIQDYKNSEGKVIQPDALPGDIIYDDYNGDGIISSEDRQIVGNPWPKFDMGIQIGASYKGFDLGINGYGRFDYDVWNGAKAAAGDFENNQNNFNGIIPWTKENHVNDRPRIVFGDSRNDRGDQDRWLEDGSFFRIRDISLGYSFPSSLIKNIGFDNLHLGITFHNLITFTNFSGLDPEFRSAGIFTRGVNNMAFPNPRSILFSLSFKF